MTMTELEDKLRKLKSKKESLFSSKADKMARLKSAKEDLRILKEEVEAKGYTLKEIPELHAQKLKELNGNVALFETALSEVEEALGKYDN